MKKQFKQFKHLCGSINEYMLSGYLTSTVFQIGFIGFIDINLSEGNRQTPVQSWNIARNTQTCFL